MKTPSKRNVVITGPSGSGKSTLVDGLRSPELGAELVIPKRVITLPLREDSNPVENRNVDHATFRNEVEEGRIHPWWRRSLGDDAGDLHMYGFETVDPDDHRTRLYLGNNAMLANSNDSIRELLRSSVLVVVTAQPEIRAERLDERLPTMNEAERSRRVSDVLHGLGELDPVDTLTLDTSGESVATSQRLFAEVVLGNDLSPSPMEKIRSTVQEFANPYLAPNPQTAG